MMETGTRLAFAAATLALTAPNQTPPLEYNGELQAPNKTVTLPKPNEWEFDEIQTTTPVEKRGVTTEIFYTRAETMAFGEVFISVFWLPGASLTPRLHAIYEHLDYARRKPANASERTLDLEPIVHATYPAVNREGFTCLCAYAPAGGQISSILLSVENKSFAKALPALLDIAQRINVNLPTWPGREAGYDHTNEAGIELAFDPKTDKSYRKTMRKLVREGVKRFSREHGAPAFTKAKPLTIYVNGDPSARAKLLHQDDEVDFLRDTGMARMVARAVHADHKADRALFASQLHKALSESILPESEKWLLRGEAHLAWGEAYTGRKLPYVRNKSLYTVSRLHLDLAECRKRAPQDFDSSVTESCAGWCAYFRLAPGKHKKAWKAYLADLRTTTDGDAAFERLIASLDSKDLHREARKVLSKKLKPAEK